MPYSSEEYIGLFQRGVLETETREEKIENLRHKDVMRYRTKTYKSGTLLECEIFPIWRHPKEATRARKAQLTRSAQLAVNARNTRKKIIRYVNNNFDDRDLWGTFGYDDTNLPDTPEQAHKDLVNFLRRIKRLRIKEQLSPLRYIYVTEYKAEDGAAIRVHHHIVMSGDMDRDAIEKLWKGGAYPQTRRLRVKEDSGLTGLASYIAKGGKNQKRWGHSANLKMPVPTIADHKITRRQAEKMVLDHEVAQKVFGKAYPEYAISNMETKLSDFVAGAYIYVMMYRHENQARGRPPDRRRT